MTPVGSSPLRPGALRILSRAVWRIGIRGEPARRRWFWRLLRIALARGKDQFQRAVTYSIIGEHFIRYTAEEVLPRLDQRLAEIRAEAALAGPRPVRAAWSAAGRDAVAELPHHAAQPYEGTAAPEVGVAAGPQA
jgi:hypothetical protein